MERYQIILAYDGSEFKGFQRQARARTVQGVVEEALRNLGWQGKSLLAAGRTDTGVHAIGQVVTFDLEWEHSLDELWNAINARLPHDVAARNLCRVENVFHPRYDATSRTYRYHIFCDRVRQPLRERFAWRIWPAADPALLQQSAALIEGTHDFATFGTPPRPKSSTVRTVFRAAWTANEEEMIFEISANAFLYHMVRHLVAVQVEVGQGRMEIEQIAASLARPGYPSSLGLAPACGLTLMEVRYNLEESNRIQNLGDREPTHA